jgi:hypothetical protein
MMTQITDLIGSIQNEADYALRYRNGEDNGLNQTALLNIKLLTTELAALLLTLTQPTTEN